VKRMISPMRYVVVLALAACSPAPARPAPAVTLRAPRVTASPAPLRGTLQRPPAPSTYAWHWAGAAPGFGQSFYRAPRTATDGALTCTFTYDRNAGAARTACASGGRELWSHTERNVFVADAALALRRGVLYVARFSDISSGCILQAFDAGSGAARWSTPLQGLGPIAHSEYLNAVEVRVIGDRPVVYGWESAGRYVEAVDPATGKTAYHALVPGTP
jgi:hypothetical protein